jgi:hypothetical protein
VWPQAIAEGIVPAMSKYMDEFDSAWNTRWNTLLAGAAKHDDHAETVAALKAQEGVIKTSFAAGFWAGWDSRHKASEASLDGER